MKNAVKTEKTVMTPEEKAFIDRFLLGRAADTGNIRKYIH